MRCDPAFFAAVKRLSDALFRIYRNLCGLYTIKSAYVLLLLRGIQGSGYALRWRDPAEKKQNIGTSSTLPQDVITLDAWTPTFTKTTRLFSNKVLRCFFAGLLIPFGFAPFHLPGLALLGLALFFAQLHKLRSSREAWISGFSFGVGYMGLGVSWVYVSIRMYGHLHPVLACSVTLLFISYLALFPALMALVYVRFQIKSLLVSACLFGALWTLSEYLRATVLGGYPWLMLGVSQMDTPLKYLLPCIGLYGVGFLACLAAVCLAAGMLSRTSRGLWLSGCVFILMTPKFLSHTTWAHLDAKPLSVSVVQANMSMRNKWDEIYFWKIIKQYRLSINELIGKTSLIVLPESAIPVPAHYLSDLLGQLDFDAKKGYTSILFGIPQLAHHAHYYNSMSSLGLAQGTYFKQHLVPFGEFIPSFFQSLMSLLHISFSQTDPHAAPTSLVHVNHHAIASLICYELAYPSLLRQQLPEAEWIVSLSDDGWFGHSFAMYQHLQMAQALAMMTARYHVMANNDGLSSVIDTQGQIKASLPAFSVDVLNSTLYAATGATPWVLWGDLPILCFCMLFVLGSLTLRYKTCSNEIYT